MAGESTDLIDPSAKNHCPTCLAEYREGVSICPDDGTVLVAGPAPQDDDRRGQIHVIRSQGSVADPTGSAEPTLFEQEEHPETVTLAVMARQDAPDLVAELESQGIGARLGEQTEDDGVQVLVHDFNLAEALATVVDFTGDPSLVDDVALDDDGWLSISTGQIGQLDQQAKQLSEAGIDVRLELPAQDDPAQNGTVRVPGEDVTEARRVLGIVV
jgi:hypothetical protein